MPSASTTPISVRARVMRIVVSQHVDALHDDAATLVRPAAGEWDRVRASLAAFDFIPCERREGDPGRDGFIIPAEQSA